MSFHFIFVTNFIRDKNPLYSKSISIYSLLRFVFKKALTNVSFLTQLYLFLFLISKYK